MHLVRASLVVGGGLEVQRSQLGGGLGTLSICVLLFSFLVPTIDGDMCTESWVLLNIFLLFTSNHVYSTIWNQSYLVIKTGYFDELPINLLNKV